MAVGGLDDLNPRQSSDRARGDDGRRGTTYRHGPPPIGHELNRSSLAHTPRLAALEWLASTHEGQFANTSKRGGRFNIVKGNRTPLGMEGATSSHSGAGMRAQFGRLAKRNAMGGLGAGAHAWGVRPAHAADAKVIAGLLTQSKWGRSRDGFGLDMANRFQGLRILYRPAGPVGLCGITDQPDRQRTDIGFKIVLAVADNLEPGAADEAADRLLAELVRVIASSMNRQPIGVGCGSVG